MEDMPVRFEAAYKSRDWQTVLDLGPQLIAGGELGKPPGRVPFIVAEAAARQGRLYEAVWYSDLGRKVVPPGTLLEAKGLCDSAYYSRRYGAPNKTLQIASIYMDHYPAYPPHGQWLLGVVLHHMGDAYEMLEDWDQAIAHYEQAVQHTQFAARDAASEAPLLADILTEANVQALLDIAWVHLQKGGVQIAGSILNEIRAENLRWPTARFAFHFYMAMWLEATAEPERSDEHANIALATADACEHPLRFYQALLKFLRARNALKLGNRHRALLYAFDAALAFQSMGRDKQLQQCEDFLRQLLRV